MDIKKAQKEKNFVKLYNIEIERIKKSNIQALKYMGFYIKNGFELSPQGGNILMSAGALNRELVH